MADTISPAALVGVTDFFLARAGDELTQWGVERFLAGLCKEPEDSATLIIRPSHLLPQTCRVISRARRLGQTDALATATDALVSDTIALPRHVSEELLRANELDRLSGDPNEQKKAVKVATKGLTDPDEITDAAKKVEAPALAGKALRRDLLMSAGALGRMVELVVGGESPSGALAAWAVERDTSIPGSTAGAGAKLGADTPVSSALYLASFTLAAFPEDTLAIDAQSDTLSMQWKLGDTVKAELGAAALLSNLQARSQSLPTSKLKLPAAAPALLDLSQTVATAWDSLNGAWAASRTAYKQAQDIAIGVGAKSSGVDAQNAIALARSVSTTVEKASEAVSQLGAEEKVSDTLKSLAGMASSAADVVEAAAQGKPDVAAVTALDIADEMITLVNGEELSNPVRVALETVTKATSFTRAILTAETPDDARTALEAVAAPTGSYAYKRRGSKLGYVTLNGYVGAGAGGESLMLSEADKALVDQPTAFAWWPTIAVGPEVGLRVNRAKAHPFSLGLQAQILDLGTLAQWRMGDPHTTDLPDVQIGHVFAPGGNLVLGLPGMPFTVMGGVALSPSLREVDSHLNLSVNDANTLRYGLGIAVDIPVLK